jgi:hypothetical protein
MNKARKEEKERIEKEERDAKELLEGISKEEDMVRDQVQRLGVLYNSSTLYVIQSVRFIARNDAFTQFQQLPHPKRWDSILPEVDIRLKSFAFNTVRNDVQYTALYKVIAVLEAVVLELSHGYIEGLHWMDLYEYMKSEEFHRENQGSLRKLDLLQRRTGFFKALEAMSRGLDRACETFSAKWEILKSDPGYTKHTMVCSPEIIQDLFDQVFSRDREWGGRNIDIANSKFLLIYQMAFQTAMDGAAPRYKQLQDARGEIQSVMEQLHDNDTHEKRKNPIHPTPGSEAPTNCMLSYNMPFLRFESVN